MALSAEIVAFAGTNTKFYEQFCDYHYHMSDVMNGQKIGAYDNNVPLSEKKAKITEAFFAEIERLSNCSRSANPDAWMANPMTRWATLAVVNAVVNAVLPAYVNASLAPFVDFQALGYGDIMKVKVQPRTLFTVSLGGHGERTTHRQKHYAGDVVITPVEHIVTVYVDMYRVLAGKDDLSEAVRKVVLSIEIAMQKDAVAALTTGLGAATYPSQFIESGAFVPQTLITLGQRVQAYNNGAKPVILGTAGALAKVLPDSTLGFRMTIPGADGSVRILKDFYGFDLIELPQIPTGVNFGLALADNVVYVVSPAVDKVVKGAMSTALNNSNQFYDNADLTQNFTMRKDWDFEFVGGAYAGKYTITG